MSNVRLSALALVMGLLLVSLTTTSALASRATNPFLDYRTESWFLPQSPSVTGSPVAGLFNPAAFALNDVVGSDLWWNDGNVRDGLDNYGFALGRQLNFAMNATTFGDRAESFKIYDYQIGVAGGSRSHTYGLGYRWSHGETHRIAREKALVFGTTERVRNWLSFGAAGVFGLSSQAAQYVIDVGVRPFQKNFLTLFADWAVNDDQAFFQDGSWSAGLEVRPLSGVHLGFRARDRAGSDDLDYSALLGVTLGFMNFAALPQYNADGDLLRTHFLVRSDPPLSGLPGQKLVIGKKTTYYPLSLENKVLNYQKYRYLDDKRVAWLDLLPLLNAVRDDDTIDIFAVNLAGFRARPSLIWELRQKLREIQAAGKEVVAHTDHTNVRTYYLASAADKVTMDPHGRLSIPGLALSRSYFKGALAKLGIGFQEHRYFKYKSAAEALSRDGMSDADREQRQRIVDVIYEELRNGVGDGRNLTAAQVDNLIDEKGVLVASEALAAGLVDQVTRWDTLLKELGTERRATAARHAPEGYGRRFWDDQWGQPVKIPVVYAVGTCAMDSGIKGRATSAYLRGLIADPDVKAVVLRADSPGGRPMPSDLVADAVRQLKAAGKPVIVSQGDVAASGGYWISMDGSKVLTTPLTITGSIGVISGWVWDDGFAEKLGVSSDTVQRGEHADLYANVNLPFLGAIPRRPMNNSELTRAEEVIRGMYDEFVDAVATGRDMDRDAVHEIAQGRVWMGGDALANGLCDDFGTLDDAIALARQAAGVADWREVQIVEYPPRPLVQWPSFGPKLPGLFGLGDQVERLLAGLSGQDDSRGSVPTTMELPLGAPGLSTFDVDYLRRLIETTGGPSLLVAPDLLPEAWQVVE